MRPKPASCWSHQVHDTGTVRRSTQVSTASGQQPTNLVQAAQQELHDGVGLAGACRPYQELNPQ